jgi:hypothetical protein
MTETVDMRQEHRLLAEETVFLQMESAAQDEGLEPSSAGPSILVSHSVDISANGLLMLVDTPLPLGSIHSVCVALLNPERRFQLIAEVKWLRPEGDQWRLGLSLFESDGSDITQWKHAIAERCRS